MDLREEFSKDYQEKVEQYKQNMSTDLQKEVKSIVEICAESIKESLRKQIKNSSTSGFPKALYKIALDIDLCYSKEDGNSEIRMRLEDDRRKDEHVFNVSHEICSKEGFYEDILIPMLKIQLVARGIELLKPEMLLGLSAIDNPPFYDFIAIVQL